MLNLAARTDHSELWVDILRWIAEVSAVQYNSTVLPARKGVGSGRQQQWINGSHRWIWLGSIILARLSLSRLLPPAESFWLMTDVFLFLSFSVSFLAFPPLLSFSFPCLSRQQARADVGNQSVCLILGLFPKSPPFLPHYQIGSDQIRSDQMASMGDRL